MFVCTGNICRSAMAEKLLKDKIEKKGLENKLSVYSAGIYASLNDVPTVEAIKVMNDEYCIDLKNHRATPITESKVHEMDLILCMTNSHKLALLSMYSNLKDKIYLLKEYVGLEGDIKDPYGGDLKIYSDCAKELNYYLDLLLEKEENI